MSQILVSNHYYYCQERPNTATARNTVKYGDVLTFSNLHKPLTSTPTVKCHLKILIYIRAETLQTRRAPDLTFTWRLNILCYRGFSFPVWSNIYTKFLKMWSLRPRSFVHVFRQEGSLLLEMLCVTTDCSSSCHFRCSQECARVRARQEETESNKLQFQTVLTHIKLH